MNQGKVGAYIEPIPHPQLIALLPSNRAVYTIDDRNLQASRPLLPSTRQNARVDPKRDGREFYDNVSLDPILWQNKN